jgi:cellulose biosynthesis protein BcsQ
MLKVRSDITRLFGAIGTESGASYQEFPRNIASRLEVAAASVPMSPPPPADTLSSCEQVEKLTEEKTFRAEGKLSSASEAVAIPINTPPNPSASQHPEEEEIDSNPPDSSGFSMLHFLSNKTPTLKATPKPGRRIPRVAIYSPLGGSGCSTIAAGLSWLLANNDQSSLIVDLGGAGMMARLFFGMQGEELERNAPWNVTVGNLSEGARLSGLVSAGRREAAAMADTVLQWVDGAASPKEAVSLVGRLGRPDWVIFDVASARFDLLDILISQVDLLVIPLRVGLEAVLAIEEMQKEVKAAKLTKNGGPPQCLYVLNQFEAENPLHLEIARMLHQDFGSLVATQPMPRDPGLGKALAESQPFTSPLFVDHPDGLLSLLLRCSLTSLSAMNA